MSLDTILGTNVQVIDLITPFLDNDSILTINRICKRWSSKRSIVVKRKYGNLGILNLFSRKLKFISKEVGELQNIETLSSSCNELVCVPSEIGQLLNLKELVLSVNKLTFIPKEFCQLSNLQILYLNNNRLRSIPGEMGQLCVILCTYT